MCYVIAMEKRIVRESHSRTLEENQIMDNIAGSLVKFGKTLLPKSLAVHGEHFSIHINHAIPVIPKEKMSTFDEKHSSLDRGTTLNFYDVSNDIKVYKENRMFYIKEPITIDKSTKVLRP